jgi:CRP-like cAMP-binding protein
MLLFRQGDESNNKCYIILSGKVLVIRENIQGKKIFSKKKKLLSDSEVSSDESDEFSDSEEEAPVSPSKSVSQSISKATSLASVQNTQ